jgi:Mrp family chromosome partitioning ATPase
VPDVANNELVRRLNEQRATVSAQLAFESRTLLPAHPRIKELGAQLADLDTQIRATAERTVRTLEANARIAGSRVDSVLAEIEAQKRRAGEANEAEVQLRALEREAKSQREQLEAYLARYRETVTRDTEKAVPADARVISRANAPGEPSFPKKGSIVVIATLASFLALMAWIVAREMVSGRGSPALAFARGAAAPFQPVAPSAVVMPLPPAEPDALTEPAGPSAERIAAATRGSRPTPEANVELGQVVSFVQAMSARGRAAVILVSSAVDPEAGAAFAVSLSRSLSRNARAVALDLDASRRGLSAAASLSGAPGMAELLDGELTFSEAIHRDRRSRLHVIPAGGSPADHLPRDDGRTVRVVVEALRATYDAVVIVVPPATAEAIANALSRLVDAAVIVDIDEGEGGERLTRDMHDAGVARVLPVSIVGAPGEAMAS